MIIIDIESSGTMFGKHNSSILSIGALDFDNPENTFYGECSIREGAEVTDSALAVNGFTREEIVDVNKPSEEDLVIQFYEWGKDIKEKTIGGQAPMNDLNALMIASQIYNIDFPFGYRTVDLHTVCYMHSYQRGELIPLEEHGASDFGLDNILAYVGLEGRSGAHNALDDAKLTAEALSRLINKVPLLSEYADFPIPAGVLK